MARIRNQQIRTKPKLAFGAKPKIRIGGWLQGRGTYLWIGLEDGSPAGVIDSREFYRLAKAVVRHYEAESR